LAFGRCHVIRFMAILFCWSLLIAACNEKSTNGDIVVVDPPEPPVHTPALDWSASWNEANNKIACLHYESDTTNTAYPSGIYVMDPDGGNRTRIFLSPRVIDLDWSHDGSYIVAN